MILLDANVLLYAYNTTFAEHKQARAWLEQTLSTPTPLALSWSTILAFLRIGTSPRVFPDPWSAEEALGIVAEWLKHPTVAVLEPSERHGEILNRLVKAAKVRGPRFTDAHLAALAVEHGAVLCTTDTGFSIFPGLRLMSPLAQDI